MKGVTTMEKLGNVIVKAIKVILPFVKAIVIRYAVCSGIIGLLVGIFHKWPALGFFSGLVADIITGGLIASWLLFLIIPIAIIRTLSKKSDAAQSPISQPQPQPRFEEL